MTSTYSKEYQYVIKTLRDARTEKGITQAKLAEALGHRSRLLQKLKTASASCMWLSSP